jgi:hypothetical protein
VLHPALWQPGLKKIVRISAAQSPPDRGSKAPGASAFAQFPPRTAKASQICGRKKKKKKEKRKQKSLSSLSPSLLCHEGFFSRGLSASLTLHSFSVTLFALGLRLFLIQYTLL